MAKTSVDDDLVMAIGMDGPELCPRSETVEISALPLGAGNLIIPSTLRCLAREGESPIAKRLLKVEKPNTRSNASQFARVTFETAPYTCYRIGAKRVTSTTRMCAVRNERDCSDPIFANLSQQDLRRIRFAVRAE